MNKNLIIALVLGAAALLAFFVLSSPSATEDKNTGEGNDVNTGGANGTQTGNDPVAQLLSNIPGVSSSSNPNAGIAAAKPVVIGRVSIPSIGWVTIYGSLTNPADHKYYLIESTSETIYPGTDKYSAIKSAVTQIGKVKVGVGA